MAALYVLFLSTLALGPETAFDPDPMPAPVLAPTIESVVWITGGPTPVDQFSSPAALAVDPDLGIFVVADRANHRLVLFDLTARCRGSVSLARDGADAPEPRSLALDSERRLFVVDGDGADVRVLSPRGSEVGRLASPWPEMPGVRAQAVAIGESGRIYVLYAGDASALAIFDPKGRHLPGLGFPPEREAFTSPVSLSVSPDESLIAVTDPLAERQVLLCTPAGRIETTFGEHGEGAGTLSLAAHAAWGPSATLWITDTLRHCIHVFHAEGEFLGRLGGFGRGPGQLLYPIACQLLESGRLLVLERGGDRCQLLELSFGAREDKPLTQAEPAEPQPPKLGNSQELDRSSSETGG